MTPPPLGRAVAGKNKTQRRGKRKKRKEGGGGFFRKKTWATKKKTEGNEAKRGLEEGTSKKKEKKNQQQQQQVYLMIIRLQIHTYIHRTKSHPFLHPLSHFFFFKLISKKKFEKQTYTKGVEGGFSSRVFRRKKGEPFPSMIHATRGKQPSHPPFSMKCFWGGEGGGGG